MLAERGGLRRPPRLPRQLSAYTSPQDAIADLDPLEKTQKVDRLDEHYRTLVKDAMDLVGSWKSRVRQLAGNERPTAEEALAELPAKAS